MAANILRFIILITLILLKVVQSLDISSYFSTKTSKVSKQEALQGSSIGNADSPLVMMETVGDENDTTEKSVKIEKKDVVEVLGKSYLASTRCFVFDIELLLLRC